MTTIAAPIDLEELRFEPLAERPSKVYLADLGRPRDGRRDGGGLARRPAEPAGRPRLEAAPRRDRAAPGSTVAPSSRRWGGTSSRRGARPT